MGAGIKPKSFELGGLQYLGRGGFFRRFKRYCPRKLLLSGIKDITFGGITAVIDDVPR